MRRANQRGGHVVREEGPRPVSASRKRLTPCEARSRPLRLASGSRKAVDAI